MKLSVILEAIDRVTAPVKRIGATVRNLTQQVGFERLTSAARVTGGAFLDTLKGATIFAAKLTAGAAVAQAALFAMTIGTADVVGAVKDTSARIGIATQSYQRLGYAAKISGSDQAELGQGLTLLNRQIDAAVRGNKSARGEFHRMGIELKDQNGKVKSTEQVFGELAERISKMPDGAAKTAAAMRFFGRSGANLIPTLNLGAAGLAQMATEAERFGVVLDTKTVDSLDDFGDGLDRWRTATTGLQFAIVGGLMPALMPLLEAATNWVATNREMIATNIAGFFAELPRYIDIVIGAFKVLYAVAQPVLAAIGMLSDLIGPTNTALVLLSATLGVKMVLSAFRLATSLYGLTKAFFAVGLSVARLALAGALSMIGQFILAIQTGTGVMGAFNVVLMANPIGAVIIAIAALAGAAYLIYQNWGAISEFFGGLWSGVQEVFSDFSNWVTTTFVESITAAISSLLSMIEPFASLLGGAVSGVSKFFSGETGGGSGRPPPPAGAVPITSRSEVGGAVHIRIDSEGRPKVQRATSDNASVPLTVDTGMVMP